MAYKLFRGKWQVFGDKPTISILSTGLICFNKACYNTFIKSTNCKYVKLYYDPDAKKIAFGLRPGKIGEFVLPITLAKTGLIAIIRAKTFLEHFGIKYKEQSRSYPVHTTNLPESDSGYSSRMVQGIEIILDEHATA